WFGRVQKRLAHDLEAAKIHDLSFVVVELSQPVIKLGSAIDLELKTDVLTRTEFKPRHAHRPFHLCQWRGIRLGNLESRAPDRIRLGVQRNKQSRKELIAHAYPLRALQFFLIRLAGGPFLKPEKAVAGGEPAYVN